MSGKTEEQQVREFEKGVAIGMVEKDIGTPSLEEYGKVVNYRIYDVLESFYLERVLEDRREYSISDIESDYPFLSLRECRAVYYYVEVLFSMGYSVEEWLLRVREDIRDSKIKALVAIDIEDVVIDIKASIEYYLEVEMIDLREYYISLEEDRTLFLLRKARTALNRLIEEYGGEKEFK